MNSGKGQTMETVKRSLLLRGWEEKGMDRQSTEDSQCSPAALGTVIVETSYTSLDGKQRKE